MDNIISLINEINTAAEDTSAAVMESMIESYDKALTILKNYDGDDLSSFDIFNESFILEGSTNEEKKESLLHKIIFFIPNLVKKLIQLIKRLIKPEDYKKLDEAIENIKQIPKDDYTKIQSILNLSDDEIDEAFSSHPKDFDDKQRLTKKQQKEIKNQIVKEFKDAGWISNVSDESSKLTLAKIVNVGKQTFTFKNPRETFEGTLQTLTDAQAVMDLYSRWLTTKMSTSEMSFEFNKIYYGDNSLQKLKFSEKESFIERIKKSFSAPKKVYTFDEVLKYIKQLKEKINDIEDKWNKSMNGFDSENFKKKFEDQIIHVDNKAQSSFDNMLSFINNFNKELFDMFKECDRLILPFKHTFEYINDYVYDLKNKSLKPFAIGVIAVGSVATTIGVSKMIKK